MVGTKIPFSAFYASTLNLKMSIVASDEDTKSFFSRSGTSLCFVQVENFYHLHRGSVRYNDTRGHCQFKATRPERKEKKGVAFLP
jgi:hypothetical protein